MTGCVLALDVGGTAMKGAVLDRDLGMHESRSFPTPVADGPDAVVEAIGDALAVLAGLAEAAGGLGPVRGIGVDVPGVVDGDKGVAVFASNIGWRDVRLVDALSARLGLPIALGHDIRVGLLAESVVGAGRGMDNLLFLTIGTGIGGAVMTDGRVIAAGGYAAEIGHVQVDPNGDQCGCGGIGCLERIASASGIARAYTARSGRPVSGAAEVAAAVRVGDPDAAAVWDRAVDGLATVLVTAVTLFGSELILVGGGLSEAGDLLLMPLRAAVQARLTFQRPVQIERPALGDRAGCVGAGVLAWRLVTGERS